MHSYNSKSVTIYRRRAQAFATSIVAISAMGSLAMVCAADPASSAAATPAAPALAFGNVDLTKVRDGYSKLDDLRKKMEEAHQDIASRLQVQAGCDMLSLDQQHQLGDLLKKTAPTDADKEAVAKLKKASADDAAALEALQQKPQAQLTATDKAEMKRLTQEKQLGPQVIQTLEAEDDDDYNAKKDKIAADFLDQMRAAVALVARDKNLSVVFESGVAPFTTNDITADVIKRMNTP